MVALPSRSVTNSCKCATELLSMRLAFGDPSPAQPPDRPPAGAEAALGAFSDSPRAAWKPAAPSTSSYRDAIMLAWLVVAVRRACSGLKSLPTSIEVKHLEEPVPRLRKFCEGIHAYHAKKLSQLWYEESVRDGLFWRGWQDRFCKVKIWTESASSNLQSFILRAVFVWTAWTYFDKCNPSGDFGNPIYVLVDLMRFCRLSLFSHSKKNTTSPYFVGLQAWPGLYVSLATDFSFYTNLLDYSPVDQLQSTKSTG